jgi:hypothetical protein
VVTFLTLSLSKLIQDTVTKVVLSLLDIKGCIETSVGNTLLVDIEQGENKEILKHQHLKSKPKYTTKIHMDLVYFSNTYPVFQAFPMLFKPLIDLDMAVITLLWREE